MFEVDVSVSVTSEKADVPLVVLVGREVTAEVSSQAESKAGLIAAVPVDGR